MKHPDITTYVNDSYYDYRGELWTLWNKNEFIPKLDFNHDKISTSKQNVLRGIHGDNKAWKLVTCPYGEVYFIIVDNNPNSPHYKKWEWTMLSDRNKKSILTPPGIGIGFLVMSEIALFHYKWAYEGSYPDVEDQFTLRWNDPNLGITWPVNDPILSLRDQTAPLL